MVVATRSQYRVHYNAAIQIVGPQFEKQVHRLALLLKKRGDSTMSAMKRARRFVESTFSASRFFGLYAVGNILWCPDRDDGAASASYEEVLQAVEVFFEAYVHGSGVSAMMLFRLFDIECQKHEELNATAEHFYKEVVDSNRDFGGTAMCRLGQVYLKGFKGEIANLHKAFSLFEKSSLITDNRQACYHMGCMLLDFPGIGLCDDGDRNRQAEFALMHSVSHNAECSHGADAMYRLSGIFKSSNKKKAMYALNRAIEIGGHLDAKTTLARLLIEGSPEIEKDVKRAVDLCFEVLEKGENAEACFILGSVVKSPKTSAGLFLAGLRQKVDQKAVIGLAQSITSMQLPTGKRLLGGGAPNRSKKRPKC